MTTDKQLKAIISWAQNRGADFTADLLDKPPAMLDAIMLLSSEEQATSTPGLCLTIPLPEGNPIEAQLGFWITPSGKKGSWCLIAEDADEIGTEWIPGFSNVNSLISFIDRKTDKLHLHYHYKLALDEWLSDNALPYHVVDKKEFSGEAAEEAFNGDLMNWLFVEFQDAGGYDITLGISGKGEAATFYSDEEGFLTFDQRGEGFKTGSDLTAWLESSITSKS